MDLSGMESENELVLKNNETCKQLEIVENSSVNWEVNWGEGYENVLVVKHNEMGKEQRILKKVGVNSIEVESRNDITTNNNERCADKSRKKWKIYEKMKRVGKRRFW